MNKKTLNSTYFRWLCGQVRNRSYIKYRHLLECLHLKEFYWSVPNDDNRMEDGLKLREIFAKSSPSFLPTNPEEPCSILEMLIALAGHMDDILSDQTFHGSCLSTRFWELIRNLGLDSFDDDHYYEALNSGTIDHILAVFVNRTYNRGGQGSLFPCKRFGKDLAKTEIWYQMMQYLDENYPI